MNLFQDVNSYLEQSVNVLRRHSMCTAPNLKRRNCLHIKTSDQAKVVAATLQCPEQIGMMGLVGLDQGAIG